jgi:hypothetical protein
MDEASSKENLDFLEQYYIKHYNSTCRERGYNLKEGGTNGKHSVETRKKISTSLLKREYHHSEETREKIRKASLVQRHSKETKKKISLSKLGKPSPQKGKVLSEETRKKMSDSAKVKIFTVEHRKKIGKSSRLAWEKRKQAI